MRKFVCILLALSLSTVVFAQKADFRKGNRQFKKGAYGEADISYRKGLLKDSTSVAGLFNLANNLYRQENYDEAAAKMDAIPLDSLHVGAFESKVLFNRGNIAMAQQDWQKAVDCYAKYLMVNPGDLEAKENYTYARYHLQNQQNQQQQQQDQNQNQNQDQNQNQNQDQDQNQQQQDQNQDQQNQDQQDDRQQGQQPQPQETQLSPQQAQRMLQAIQEKEKQTQEKVDEKKAAALKSRQKEKNW